MTKCRIWIGWAAIAHAAITFLPLPLPILPPSQWMGLAYSIPVIGMALLTLLPMLLFAAGIGLVKQWDGGRKLFAIWAAIIGAGALSSLSYDLTSALIDLAIVTICLVILFWSDWRKIRWQQRVGRR